MSTAAQITANRVNARRSTGPTTPEGKARASKNATRHGLCGGIALMHDEGPEEFDRLHADLREEHQPIGPTEDILVYKMAEQFYASNRAQVLLAEKLTSNDFEDCSKQISLMLRYHTTADRAFYRALNELRKLQKERRNTELSAAAIGSVSQTPETTPSVPLKLPEEALQTDAGSTDSVFKTAPVTPFATQKAA